MVAIVADLGGGNKIVYDEKITVQVTDDPCMIAKWQDVDFGTLSYTIGSKKEFKKETSNNINAQGCSFEAVSFADEEGTIVEWFSFAAGTGTEIRLDIFLDHTNRAEFWSAT